MFMNMIFIISVDTAIDLAIGITITVTIIIVSDTPTKQDLPQKDDSLGIWQAVQILKSGPGGARLWNSWFYIDGSKNH